MARQVSTNASSRGAHGTHFRFSTTLLQRLGEELNPSLERGLIELVKNAYDADAKDCLVELIDTDAPGGTVRVSDNGTGMSLDDIKNGWLMIGRSAKRREERTPILGRVPAGSKGLGRLAALRMGGVAILDTKKADETVAYHLAINWSEFDVAATVEDVKLHIERDDRAPKAGGGTTIQVSKLRNAVRPAEVRRLARELLLLADPFTDTSSAFRPRLVAAEFEDLEHLVRASYFPHADYQLDARLDGRGRAHAVIRDFRGKTLFEAAHGEISNRSGGARYVAPKCRFEFWTFILNKASFAGRAVSLREIREWLGQFGGVHIYDGGLRVHPYGNAGNDWLELNLQRARSPEERPSTNNSIGRLTILAESGALLQKTDRSGYIETDEFNELRRFGQDALEWMARRRLELAEKRRRQNRNRATHSGSRETEAIAIAIAGLPEKARPDLVRAVDEYARSRDREVADLRQEVQLYRTLSTAGITAATFAHDSAGSPIKVIVMNVKTIERRAKRELAARYAASLQEPVDSIIKATDSLSFLSNATLRLVDHEKRRQAHVDLHAVVLNVVKTFEAFLGGREISVHLRLADGSPFLRASEAAIESVVTNLLNNSVAAFERSSRSTRDIWISTKINEGNFLLIVDDNGPGIEAAHLNDIWLPGYSTRPNGTGLGLTIVRDSTIDLGGTTDVRAHGDHGGAQFTVTLPIIGV
jgi:signal transduction histidine kinase